MASSYYQYAPLSVGWRRSLILGIGACILVLAVLCMLLITQQSASVKKQSPAEPIEISIQPPLPPEQIEQTPSAQPTPVQSQLQPQEEANIELDPLDLSLQPAMVQVNAGRSASLENFSLNVSDDIKSFMRFEDLSSPPRVVTSPRIVFPRSLERRGVTEGKVTAEIAIDSEGKAKLVRIINATHPELVPVAEKLIRDVRFTKPMQGSQVVDEVHGIWPIFLKSNA